MTMTIPVGDVETQKYHAPVAVPVNGGSDAVTPVDAPSHQATPYLEVVAPATLPEGYTFNAEANGQSFMVKVPEGGVEKGQKFSVPFPASSDGYMGSAIPHASVPVGHWKDGVCDCCRFGPIHPVIWNAWCCPLILAGQVLQRLKLTWLGNEGTVAQTTSTFRTLLLLTAANLCVDELLKYLTAALTDASDYDEYGYPASAASYGLVYGRTFFSLCFGIFTVFLVAKTRKRIRSKYGIPEQQCAGCEDCCCSFWCNCCTVAQMARHTADYDTYAGLCCSETGMPAHAPSIV